MQKNPKGIAGLRVTLHATAKTIPSTATEAKNRILNRIPSSLFAERRDSATTLIPTQPEVQHVYSEMV
jgi:hypothetical protein